MHRFWYDFVLAFVPIFVAMDILGVLPIYASLTEGIPLQAKRRVVGESLLTALLVAVSFVILGKSIFRLLNITVDDFLVAGGVLLFLIATIDLVAETHTTRKVSNIAAVPLGTPLIVGPGVLTTTLMLATSPYHILVTTLAVVANIGIAGVVLLAADRVTRVIGQNGSRAVSKVASLLLGAIAVMMIRKGLTNLLTGANLQPIGAP